MSTMRNDRLLASHCFDYEYPYLVSFRHLFETCVSPLATNLHPWPGDRWTWRFTTPDPLRRAFSGWRSELLIPALPIEPCLWHPCRSQPSCLVLSHQTLGSRSPRPLPSSLR